MSKKPSKGLFRPRNPQKYLGANVDSITFRSTWELTAMNLFDQHPNVLGWMSESFPTNHAHFVKEGEYGIPYRNPLTNKWTYYVPDFFVIYLDKTGKQHVEVFEIKPLDEVPFEFGGPKGKVSKLKEAKQIVNGAKYMAAIKFCAQRGWFFRIITGEQIFAWSNPK